MSPSDETSELEQLLVTFCSLLGPYDADDWSNIQHTFHLRKNRPTFQVSFMLCALWRWARWAWGLAGSTHYGEN
jgi:hypothetical protein